MKQWPSVSGVLRVAARGRMRSDASSGGCRKIASEPPGTQVYVGDSFSGTAKLLASRRSALMSGVKYLTFKTHGSFPQLTLEL